MAFPSKNCIRTLFCKFTSLTIQVIVYEFADYDLSKNLANVTVERNQKKKSPPIK